MSRVDLIWFLIGQKVEVTQMLLTVIPRNSSNLNFIIGAEARLQDIFCRVGCVLPAQVTSLYENTDFLFEEVLQLVQSYNV